MTRVVISGYYGFGNAGDEAMLAGMKEGLEALLPGVRLTVLSGDPSATRRIHGVEAVPRMHPAAVLGALAASQLLISGGGSLLQDVTSQKNIPYYLGVVSLARTLGKPVMIYAQGIGPVCGAVGRRLMPAILNRVSLITVRDESSAALLRDLGVTRPPLAVTSDASLALEPAVGFDTADALVGEGLDPGQRPIIGLALRSWREGVGVAQLAQLADGLVAELGGQVLFLPMHLPDDLEVSRAVRDRMRHPAIVLTGHHHPRELLALVGALDLVIGMRLHALIFAASAGVPMLGLSYDPKIDAFLDSLGWEACWTVGEVAPAEVIAAARQALERQEALRARLGRQVASLRRLARQNTELAVSLLLSQPLPLESR